MKLKKNKIVTQIVRKEKSIKMSKQNRQNEIVTTNLKVKEMRKYTVVVDAWQMQCCGNPFKIGETVEWFVYKWEFENLLIDVGNIDFYYEHHSDDETKLLKLKGNVEKILAIHYAYQKESEESKLMLPISGIAVEIEQADGWDKNIDNKELYCYYVCLDKVSLQSIKESEVPYP